MLLFNVELAIKKQIFHGTIDIQRHELNFSLSRQLKAVFVINDFVMNFCDFVIAKGLITYLIISLYTIINSKYRCPTDYIIFLMNMKLILKQYKKGKKGISCIENRLI